MHSEYNGRATGILTSPIIPKGIRLRMKGT